MSLAVDVDPIAIEVHRRNFDPEYYSTENLWGCVTNQYSVVESRQTLGSWKIRASLGSTPGLRRQC